MTHQITIKPSGHTYQVAEGETILTGAIDAGVNLPYGCRNGACGACKGKVLAGEIDHGDYQSSALSDAEKAEGLALFCCAKALSDVEIECREVSALNGIKPRILPVRVQSMEKLSHDVMALFLKLPSNERMQFMAGQYVEFLLKDGKRRAFSLANAPHNDEFLELHLRLVPGGAFTEYVFNQMQEKAILRLEGPFGSFYLREASDKPIILLASGTGFAPIKALIEHLQHIGSERPVTLYWGGRRPADLYMADWVQAQMQTMPQLKYVPVVSNAEAEDQWQGRTGFVHQAVLQDHPDLSGHQVYACGAPIVVESAQRDYVQLGGLPSDEFYADAFTSEADKATS